MNRGWGVGGGPATVLARLAALNNHPVRQRLGRHKYPSYKLLNSARLRHSSTSAQSPPLNPLSQTHAPWLHCARAPQSRSVQRSAWSGLHTPSTQRECSPQRAMAGYRHASGGRVQSPASRRPEVCTLARLQHSSQCWTGADMRCVSCHVGRHLNSPPIHTDAAPSKAHPVIAAPGGQGTATSSRLRKALGSPSSE